MRTHSKKWVSKPINTCFSFSSSLPLFLSSYLPLWLSYSSYFSPSSNCPMAFLISCDLTPPPCFFSPLYSPSYFFLPLTHSLIHSSLSHSYLSRSPCHVDQHRWAETGSSRSELFSWGLAVRWRTHCWRGRVQSKAHRAQVMISTHRHRHILSLSHTHTDIHTHPGIHTNIIS